jgi:ABC-type uncharacterized transport system auxiliary subunit
MIRALFLCLACAGLMSCGGPKSASEQLILFFDPPALSLGKETAPAKGYPFKVQVKDLELNRLYDNASVVIRSGDNTVQFSRKGVWAVRPNASASDLLQDVLKQNMKFRALKERFAESSPDYIIQGSLDNIEEDLRKPEERDASLTLTLQIIRASDDQLVFEKRYSRTTPVSDPASYSVLAREMSVSLLEIYRLFVVDAVHVFNKELETSNAKNDGKDQ